MKKITLKGFADYMTASATKQRNILRQYKYPQDDDSKAKILYYRDARDRINIYHFMEYPVQWLTDESRALQTLAHLSSGRRKTRLRHNARALLSYARNFGGRQFDTLDDIQLNLRYGDVAISVRPDLHVTERGSEKIVKLEFNKDEPSQEMVKIISQIMFEAATNNGLDLTSSSVLYLDVPRGVEHRGARMGSRLRSNIEATCENISAIWDSI